MTNEARWRIAVDTGGTFTDCLAIDPEGGLHRVKVLSRSALRGEIGRIVSAREFVVREDWSAPDDFVRGFAFRMLGGGQTATVAGFDAGTRTLRLERDVEAGAGKGFEVLSPEEAPVLAARLATRTLPGEQLPPMTLRLATTRGTNALLEEKGAKVALFVTEGFGDLLRIGTQQRPDLFAREVVLPGPIYHSVIEVAGRLDASGEELRPLDLESCDARIAEARASGCTAAAVALLHSYRDPRHEERLAAHLAERGLSEISVSSRLAPFVKVLPRADTVVVDAYLAAILRGYLERVGEAVPLRDVYVMSSSGGLAPAADFQAKDSLLSGPAGGVIGAAAAARRCGARAIVAFDMGGTSTDVSWWEGDFDYQFQHTVGRARLVAPALKIETVAAGGGSICRFDGGRLRVGPDSAGADPGSACYGAGGPLTLTDVNLLLGRMDAGKFGLPLDARASEKAASALAVEAGLSREEMLRGCLQIANERMAAAIGRISIREGYDPAEAALVAFGGAGGQHACAIADLLGMRTVICPAEMGLLSASGLEQAVLERFAEEQVLAPLAEVKPELASRIERLERAAAARLEEWGAAEIEIRRRIVQARLAGQEAALDVDFTLELERAFQARYEELYGYFPAGKTIEVLALRVVASTRKAEIVPERFEPSAGEGVIQDRFRTLVVDPGWEAASGSGGTLRLSRRDEPGRGPRRRDRAVDLELFTHRFESVVEEMGVLLQRTALSTNMKERLDFSCALLDAKGELIVNAPHIPVHLGAIGLCVRTVAERLALAPGDMIVTNHPGAGGSHLPDVTVISPVFERAGRLLGYVANRGHHAEIGGVSPGSMPPAARSLAEEGVVIPPTYLFRAGRADYDAVRRTLAEARWPSRAVEDNLADLAAQAAANRLGVRTLETLAERHGAERVAEFMAAIKTGAAEAMSGLLREFPAGECRAVERLDDGTDLEVRLEAAAGRLRVHVGSGCHVHPGNLNATPAIVRSVLVYVLRLWLQRPLPLNEGLLEPVTLSLKRCFLSPEFPDDPALAPAVVGGNVETSQRLVDAFVKALGLLACGQGTMNNLVFGNARCSYYETIGGGCGAGPGFNGASGVHSHMTNTAITDPEILELRFPVRLERFALRAGSGGEGRWRGGEGLIRELVFLEPVSVSLLTQHRVERPFGGDGGEPGALGRQTLQRENGETIELPSIAQIEAGAGDKLIIETPGGGGWGG